MTTPPSKPGRKKLPKSSYYRQPESKLSRQICEAIHETFKHSAVIKVSPSQYMAKGCPDILGCVNGRMVAIEVKMPGKESRLTPEQRKWLDRFADAGGISILATSVRDAIIMIEEGLWGLPTEGDDGSTTDNRAADKRGDRRVRKNNLPSAG